MNRKEYLLACLAEECDEVGQRAMKALRFSLAEVQPGQPLSNAERISEEYADLVAVFTICVQEGLLPAPKLDVLAKRAKIEKFMAISRKQGVLSEALRTSQDKGEPTNG